MSANSMTPVTSISEITTKTTMVGLSKLEPSMGRVMVGLEPVIHRNIASTTSPDITHSLRDIGPIVLSWFAAHATISGLSLTSGRQTT